MKKKNETEEKIIKLATRLIQERGVNAFSFADIAQEIGIRKASVHYYFSSKLDLIARVIEDYTDNFERELLIIKEQQTDLFQHLVDFVTLYRNNIDQRKICLCSMLAMENESLSEEINQSVQAFFTLNVEWLKAIFKETGLSAEDRANDFFASLQGAQLLAKVGWDMDSFDQFMAYKIVAIQKSKEVFKK